MRQQFIYIFADTPRQASPANHAHRLSWIAVVLLAGILPVWILPVSFANADEVKLAGNSPNVERGTNVSKGEVLIRAQDGSLLFERNDGQLLILRDAEIESVEESEEAVEPLDKEAIASQLLAELPEGFKIHETKSYVIAYQTEREYARWIGNLYEGKLNRAFRRFWKNRRFRVTVEEPAWPLVAVIFSTKQQYEAYQVRELGSAQDGAIAYYNIMTNRVAMYDLTVDQVRGGRPLQRERDIEEVFQNPRSIRMVSTIIHEGTHQLMFNSGLQTRMAETPRWFNEGIAMFFETPDLGERQGWKAPGKVNYERLKDIFQLGPMRPPNSLRSLIESDDRLIGGTLDSRVLAYAESWSLIHFLINRKPKEFGEYLKFMAKKKRLDTLGPAERVTDFTQFFGDDFEKLESEFASYVRSLR